MQSVREKVRNLLGLLSRRVSGLPMVRSWAVLVVLASCTGGARETDLEVWVAATTNELYPVKVVRPTSSGGLATTDLEKCLRESSESTSFTVERNKI